MSATETAAARPTVSVIIPARNEEVSLGACLESLVSQGLCGTGTPARDPSGEVEIIVVNDHSTDRTREIAESFAGVRVLEAGPLPAGWTGKNNAVATGVREARGEWLLFTDADTVHLAGSLARAAQEAQSNQVEMLSYSPEQTVVTFWEKATLPVVFAELARQYPPSKVSDPDSPEAAANGQYILVTRAAYDAVGGHAAVATEVLEDVAFARAVKRSGRKICFRYAPDAVRTRMYHNFKQVREGWTKNLALLFPNPTALAAQQLLLWALPWCALALSFAWRWPWGIAFLAAFMFVTGRIRRAHFSSDATLLAAIFGMPMFAYLLLRSKQARAKGNIQWKGRNYSAPQNEPKANASTSNTARTTVPQLGTRN